MTSISLIHSREKLYTPTSQESTHIDQKSSAHFTSRTRSCGSGTRRRQAEPGEERRMDGAPRRYEMGGAGPAGNVESAARRARRGRGGELSIATVHAHVNENRPESYWNYDSLQVSLLGRKIERQI